MPVIDPNAKEDERPAVTFVCRQVPFMTFHTANGGSEQFEKGILVLRDPDRIKAARTALAILPYPYRNYVDEVPLDQGATVVKEFVETQSKIATQGPFTSADRVSGADIDKALAARIPSGIQKIPDAVIETLREAAQNTPAPDAGSVMQEGATQPNPASANDAPPSLSLNVGNMPFNLGKK